MDTLFNREPGAPRFSRRQLAVTALVAVLAVPGSVWAVGAVRHNSDIEWCSSGRVVNEACVARRESRRWGPFLAFGPSANRSRD